MQKFTFDKWRKTKKKAKKGEVENPLCKDGKKTYLSSTIIIIIFPPSLLSLSFVEADRRLRTKHFILPLLLPFIVSETED